MTEGITDATKHERELIEEWQRKTIDNFLKDLSTKELTDELCKREGVDEHIINPHQRMAIVVGDRRFVDEGPARILVVTD